MYKRMVESIDMVRKPYLLTNVTPVPIKLLCITKYYTRVLDKMDPST